MDFYKDKKFLIAIVIGALGGYAYYYFVGCRSGSCAITSNPTISTLYGAMIGGIAMFPSKKKKEDDKLESTDEN